MLEFSPAVQIREALSALPPLAAHSTGERLDPSDIFFPISHSAALDPEVTLVVGNRGMGKSFWASALAHEDTRNAISEAYGSHQAGQLQNVDVHFAFADAEGGGGGVSKREIASAGSAPIEAIWRAALLRHLAKIVNVAVPRRFSELVKWVVDNPEEEADIFRLADTQSTRRGRKLLFLFDQLDHLSDSWPSIQALTQGILRLALSMKSYRSIKVKIFMRPDQADNKELFRFPDASKVSGTRARLKWRSIDLYGLLFFHLFRDAPQAMTGIMDLLRINADRMHHRLPIPTSIAISPENQNRLFDHIAGPYMGNNKKRGFTYTWIPLHLADGNDEVSPRTFLKVMKTAGDYMPPPPDTAINYLGIQQGVREASENRLSELQEDYPWVSTALDPLRGAVVPCEVDDVVEKWIQHSVVEDIRERYRGAQGPLELEISGNRKDPPYGLLSSLHEIGVVELRTNGKLNVPDIFRLNAGILRRGGVTPQQRRKL